MEKKLMKKKYPSSLSNEFSFNKTQIILERLRGKSSMFKNFIELARNIRTTLLDRRFSLDVNDKSIYQKSLEFLHDNISAKSAIGMAEKIETTGRKIGLKFNAAPVHGCFYLSTEMFYVEINIDNSGNVNEAKIIHIDVTQSNPQSNSQNCPEIIECLSKEDFSKFIQHLEGLISIYNLPQATSLEKSKSWISLMTIENDLEKIYKSINFDQEGPFIVNQSPIGLVEPRAGGLPTRIRFHVSPLDFINENDGTIINSTTQNIISHDLGLSLTLSIEKSETKNFLPKESFVEKDGFSKTKLNTHNSYSLPAKFTLQLSKPIPLSLKKCKEITDVTDISLTNFKNGRPLMQLIVKNSGCDISTFNSELFVSLPDHQQCYMLSDLQDQDGIFITSIPFSHPSNIPKIINILRKQAIFNSLIESCIRPNNNEALENCYTIKLSSLDICHLNISFENPIDGSIQSVYLKLCDAEDRITCQIHNIGSKTLFNENFISNVATKSLSLPIIMRAIYRNAVRYLKPEVFKERRNTNIGNHFYDSNKPIINDDFIPDLKVLVNKRGSINRTAINETADIKTDSLNTNRPRDATFNLEAQNLANKLLARTSNSSLNNLNTSDTSNSRIQKNTNSLTKSKIKKQDREKNEPITDFKAVNISSNVTLKKMDEVKNTDFNRKLPDKSKSKHLTYSSKKRKLESGSYLEKKNSNLTEGLKTVVSQKNSNSISKAKLASVIDRLAQNSAETGIEIIPASNNKILNQLIQTKDKSSNKSVSANSLKLTIKTSSKNSKTKDKSPISCSPSKDKFTLNKNSISHLHNQRCSIDNPLYCGNKARHSISEKSQTKHSFNSSNKSKIHPKEVHDEVKKLLGGGKLNKTFQIPKLHKSSSPSKSAEINTGKHLESYTKSSISVKNQNCSLKKINNSSKNYMQESEFITTNSPKRGSQSSIGSEGYFSTKFHSTTSNDSKSQVDGD